MAPTDALALLLAVAVATWVTRKELGGALWRHLAVQSSCAASVFAFAVTFQAATASAAYLGALATLCVAVARVDRRTFVIPDVLVLALGALALAAPYRLAPVEQLVGAVVMGGVFLLVREGYARLRHADGLGLGDVKLAMIMGASVGAEAALLWTAVAATLTALWLAAPVTLAAPSPARAAAPFGVGLAAALMIATATIALGR